MLFICYPKCDTCRKAKKWLDEHGVVYKERNIKENNPTCKEITKWFGQSSLPLKKFFNTSGVLYKDLRLSQKLTAMSEEEQIKLLASDGMLVKRPLLISDKFVMVGFRENDWKEALQVQ